MGLNSCSLCFNMDYRARGSWIGNVCGRLSKAGYGGSDVMFNNFIVSSRCVLSVERVTSHPTLKIQQEMEKAIMNDPSVTAYWNYLLTKVADLETDESDELLGEIVDKWVKIRGHSFASGWVKQYQIATKQSTKTKGLRKSLQQTSDLDHDAQS